MNDPMIGFFGKTLIPVAVIGVFVVFRKYFPAPIEKTGERCSFEDLDRRFQRTKWIFNLCMIAIGILFAWSTHAVFVWLNRDFAAASGPAVFYQFPQSAIWWFSPGFGAVALSYEITLQLWSLFGSRRDADLYSRWSNMKNAAQGGRYASMDSRKALRWLSVLIVLPIGVFTVLELHSYVSIGANTIRDCGYAFAPCKSFPYAAAQRMTIIKGFRDKDGKLTKQAGIVLDFSDGSRWSSADMGDFQQSVDPALADFLKKKTQLSINYAETETDVPPLGSQR
jgi:hypothetical protein